jgi:PAS domain S-box-containing protein
MEPVLTPKTASAQNPRSPLEKRILEMVAKGDSLAEILDNLCRLVETQAGDVLASILLLDGDRLRHGGAPSLPKAYTDAINGTVIGPSAGSCGTAAYRGEPVIVEDIATDPLWADYRDLALSHSLCACWSTPVFSSQGEVIATFAMYYRERRRPTQRDQEVIDQITHLAGAAIQQKLAEEKLKRSEAYLARAQKLTHTGSWAWDPRTEKVLYCSEEMFRVFGLDPRESLPSRDNFRQRIHPEDRDWVTKRFEKSLRERVDTFGEYRILLPDGTIRHINASGHPVLDEHGELIEFVGTAVDVTERKRAELERRRLASLVEQAAGLMAIADLSGGTPIYLNKAGMKMVGFDSWEEASARRGIHYIFPADRQFVNEVLWPTVLEKGSWSGEMRFRHFKTGDPIPVLYSAFRIDDPETGQPVNVGNVCRDITERKRAESALQQSQAYLTQAQELSRTGSFGWTVATGEIIWSEETFRIFQCDRTTRPTVGFMVQRAHPDDRAAVQQTIDLASIDGKDFDHEYRLLMPDGSVKYVHAVARAERDASGSIEFVGAVTDVTAAKEAERKLRRSEAYLAEAQRLSHTSSWAWDARRREFVYRSPEAYRMLGLDPEKDAVSQQPLWDRVHSEDRNRVIEMVWQAVREKTDFEGDYRIVLPDGSTKYVHSVGHTVIGDDGEVTELVGTHVDVTEQHAAKEALQKAFDEIKKSEDRLRLVIDTIPTLVWRAGPEGIPDFLNQPALDYTGLSLDQAETGWPRAFHPDDKKGMLQKWSAIRESGVRGGLEARLRRFDGEYRWFLFEAEPLRDESGNTVKWYGSSTDIEDRKRAEEALRESEQRFRDYAETASDWLWETGPDHRVTRVSEHLNAVGIVPSRLTGVARWDIATDVESEPEKWRLHKAMHDEHRPFRNFVYTVNGTGSPVYVQASGKPFYDTNGNFLGYRGTGTNITASIRADHAEQALRKAQAELAHVTRVTTLGEMTASIAHEVNQPLAAVVANAEACLRWLDRGTPDLDAVRRSVEWVIDDGNRASEVIGRVRALAKKTNIEKVPLDVNEVVREVIALVRGELISHQVSVRTEFASALHMILADRVQLQQVIINLVMNGIEAMQSVTVRPRELVIRSCEDETQQVLVSVTDCGVGISAENADQLFDAFFTTKSSGMGMGLSICRSIMEAHGGRLWATANLPYGASFHLTLPLIADTAS